MRFLFLAALVFFPSIARAESYAPGTVGYLYDDCAHALENSVTPGDFLNTYCGGFVEGYGMGVLVSYAPKLPAPSEQDPCKTEKQNAYNRINGRLCENLPDYTDPKTPPGLVLQTATQIVARWHDYLVKNNKLDVLGKPATQEINALITPGKFCDTLKTPADAPSFKINPALLAANWYDFVQKGPVTLQDKYIQCKADLSAQSFTGTRCAAEIEGFIAGIYSTHRVQKYKPVKGACGKEIDRMYESLDLPGNTCVTTETDPSLVARVFVQNIESAEKTGGNLGAPGFGGAGYQAIYYGFMCSKK